MSPAQLLSKRSADGKGITRFAATPTEWGPGARGKAHVALQLGEDEKSAEKSAEDPGASGDATAGGGGGAEVVVVGGGSGSAVASMHDKRARNQGRRGRAAKRRALGADRPDEIADEIAEGSGGDAAGEGAAEWLGEPTDKSGGDVDGK